MRPKPIVWITFKFLLWWCTSVKFSKSFKSIPSRVLNVWRFMWTLEFCILNISSDTCQIPDLRRRFAPVEDEIGHNLAFEDFCVHVPSRNCRGRSPSFPEWPILFVFSTVDGQGNLDSLYCSPVLYCDQQERINKVCVMPIAILKKCNSSSSRSSFILISSDHTEVSIVKNVIDISVADICFFSRKLLYILKMGYILLKEYILKIVLQKIW